MYLIQSLDIENLVFFVTDKKYCEYFDIVPF